MKNKLRLTLSLIILVLAYQALAAPVGQITLMSDFSKQVAKCLKDFEKLTPGMTRSEIKRMFPRDGGLHGVSEVRFVHPDCPYFKVDVKFEFKRNSADKNRAIRGDDDPAISISKPYIEGPNFD